MSESPTFAFGTSAKQQVAKRIQTHVAANFDTDTKAAKSLGITRQRLFSYTSGKALPRAPIFDLVLEKWGLDLLGGKRQGAKLSRARAGESRSAQQSLFESPITLKNDDLKVVIKRKGPRLVASIEIYADVEIA